MSEQDQTYGEPFRRIQPEEAKELIDAGTVTVIDVREPGEYARDHIPNSELVPLGRIISSAATVVEAEDDVIFVCEVGQRSAVAAELAASLGKERLFNLEGGMTAWRAKGYPVEK
ncbi:MAG: rhodanese-like domain-containing protein [Chloroflexota bacterium]|nr:rhodanese-like domain-containing protein [Chloroflexota bacterium]